MFSYFCHIILEKRLIFRLCSLIEKKFSVQVRKLLKNDPGNAEYADVEKELVEVFFNSFLHSLPFLYLIIFFCLAVC